MQESMGMLQTKATECQYKEYDRLLTEQFINGLNVDGMVDRILSEVAIVKDIEDATSICVLAWAHRVEVQRAQKSVLHEIQEAKAFDIIKWHTETQVQNTPKVVRKEDS